MVGFYGISTIVASLMPNPLYTYILNIYDLVWLGLWHINPCRSFNAKSSLCIKYIGFGLVGFYGISTVIGHLIPNPLYIYIYIQYVWLVNTFLVKILKLPWANLFFHTVKFFQVL